MWRHLIKTFERSLVLNSQQILLKNTTQKAHFIYTSRHLRSLACSGPLRNTEAATALPPEVNEGDPEYIIPYKIEYEKRDSAQKLIDTLSRRFRLSEEDVEHIMNDEVVMRNYRQKSLMQTLDMLCMEGVSKRNFVEYPWIITLDRSKLFI